MSGGSPVPAPVRKAVVPAAGRGTRMRPFSEVVPKELLPLGTEPVLERVLREIRGAGIDEVALVCRPDKPLLRDYVAARQGSLEGLAVTWVEQAEPLGLGDAIACCREFLAGEPFALVLPDNVFVGEEPPGRSLTRLLRAWDRDGREVLGVLALGAADSDRYGNCGRLEFELRNDGHLDIRRLHGKSPGTLRIEAGETVHRNSGRSICSPDFLDRADALRDGTEGEIDELPVFQSLVDERGATGVVLDPPPFDVGNPAGYTQAWAAFAAASATGRARND